MSGTWLARVKSHNSSTTCCAGSAQLWHHHAESADAWVRRVVVACDCSHEMHCVRAVGLIVRRLAACRDPRVGCVILPSIPSSNRFVPQPPAHVARAALMLGCAAAGLQFAGCCDRSDRQVRRVPPSIERRDRVPEREITSQLALRRIDHDDETLPVAALRPSIRSVLNRARRSRGFNVRIATHLPKRASTIQNDRPDNGSRTLTP